jgi:hypothetical protein
LERDRQGGQQGSQSGQQDAGAVAEAGLEIETGFQKWLTFAGDLGPNPESRAGQAESALRRAQDIEAEQELLVRLAPQWDAGEFFRRRTEGAPDFTRGSEHFVVRYRSESGARVLKATIPGKFGRWEYTPTIYLNSLRLLQGFAPGLDIRMHGIIVTEAKPTIVTSMQYIPGRHPHPRQVENYLFGLGWERFDDESETLDFRQPALRQIIRDAHPLNWVYRAASEALVPVDISIEQY